MKYYLLFIIIYIYYLFFRMLCFINKFCVYFYGYCISKIKNLN